MEAKRRIVMFTWLTANGYFAGADGNLDWVLPDEEQAKAAEAAEQGSEAPTPAAESAPPPEPEPSDTDTEPGAPVASTASEPDETPPSDIAPTDVQETPEG